MSYCRFGDNDAYIYMSYSGFECCGCIMAPRIPLEHPYTDMLGFTHEVDYGPVGPFTTARAMLEHIAEHRAKGHHISADVDVSIMAEYPYPDASVVETDEERELRIKASAPDRARILEKMKKAYEESQDSDD